MSKTADDEFKLRETGQRRTGTVGVRSFDEGVFTTLGATVQTYSGKPGYYISNVPGVCGPAGTPGVPVIFANPEDVIQPVRDPYILVHRDNISPAMDRWQPGGQQYRVPGLGAIPFIATGPGGVTKSGFSTAEVLRQADPYDITYTISIRARYRGSSAPQAQRNSADRLFAYVLRIYPAYGKVDVVDSIGDFRSYEAFNTDGIANLDSIAGVTEREIGYAITLRVEAELDLKDPITVQLVRSLPRTTFTTF